MAIGTFARRSGRTSSTALLRPAREDLSALPDDAYGELIRTAFAAWRQPSRISTQQSALRPLARPVDGRCADLRRAGAGLSPRHARQRLLLHVPTSRRLAYNAEVDIADLADEDFVASPTTFHLRSVLETWCSEAGFTPRVPFEINEIDTVRALVSSGMGVAILPPSEHPDPGVAALPLSGNRTRDVGLVTGHHRPTAAVDRFRSYILGLSLTL